MSLEIDIHYRGNGIAKILSNLYNHQFVFKGRKIKSIESFLQGIKHCDVRKQEFIFGLDGLQAKNQSIKIKDNTLYFDVSMNRYSDAYKLLLLEVYTTMASQNKEFCEALRRTKGYRLTHYIGGKSKSETILTEYEFISILEKIRDFL